MIILEENIQKLIDSPITEDIILGYIIINQKYGWKYWGEYLFPPNKKDIDKVNYKSEWIHRKYPSKESLIIKVKDYKFAIHVMNTYMTLNTYKNEWNKLIPGEEYSICGMVYEI